jgi:hypothetical protein
MGGLNLGVGGRLTLGGPTRTIAPATIAQTAYGGGAAPTNQTGIQRWHLAVAVPVASLIWLGFLRWSLPG